MRDDLDDILIFIGSTSLTDLEFESIDDTNIEVKANEYTQLKLILESRESVSTMLDRLSYYYLAQGVAVIASTKAKTNILVGASLED